MKSSPDDCKWTSPARVGGNLYTKSHGDDITIIMIIIYNDNETTISIGIPVKTI